MLELAGHFVPLVTPFTDDGAAMGEVRLARLLRFYTERKVDGYVIATDTGEFTTLTLAERKLLVEWVHRFTQGAAPMVVNVSTLSTSNSLDLAQHASRHGARAVIVMPPFYGQVSQTEHVQHIRMIASHSSRPVIVVDPESVLQESAIAEITHISNVHLAWPQAESVNTQTDWFRCYGLVVEPMLAVPDSVTSDFLLRNRAAVAKTLMIDMDLEVGTPRMPAQPVPYREIRKAA